MKTQTYRGIVRDGRVVFLDNGKQPMDGTEVVVTPLESQCGTGAAVVAAIGSLPKVPAEWVDELERLIAEGKRPPTLANPLDETEAQEKP